jgi:threonine dehydrogenase-like Zn-dependent dehydrogenase
LEVHVFDRAPSGIKPDLVHALGGTYHFGTLADVKVEADIILECTGASAVIWDVLSLTARAGIVCLTGVSLGGHRMSVDIGQMNRDIVLENDVVFGTVNANRRHYEAAVQALTRADASWLRRLITRRIPLSEWREALRNEKEDVKVVLELTS